MAIIAAVVLSIAGLYPILTEIGRPFPGYISYGYVGRPLVNLGYETPNWFPGWRDAGLKPGDELWTINGLPYHLRVRAETARAYEAGSTMVVGAYRPSTGEEITAELSPRLFTVYDFLDLKFPEALVWAVFVILAVVVLRAQPNSPVNRIFALVAALFGLHRMTAMISVATDAGLLVNLPRMAHMIAAGLIPPLIFHMAFLFPIPIKPSPTRLLRVIYGIGISTGVIMAMTRMPLWARLPVELGAALDLATFHVMMALLFAGIVTLFGRLIWVWHGSRSGNRRVRRVAGIVLAGLIAALPPVITILAPGIPGFGQRLPSFWEGLDLRYFLLAIPIAFALVIIRYHAFQSPTPLFIFVVAFSTSALLTGVVMATWSALLPDGAVTPGSPHFQVLFFSVLIASFFWSRQSDWRGWFGLLLHRTDRNFESARSFGNRVMSRTPLQAMPETIATALVDELDVERAAVWTYDVVAGAYELAGAAGGVAPPVPPRLVPASGAPAPDRVIHVGWPETPLWLGRPAAEGRIEVVTPLKVNERMIGLLGVGRRWDEDIFDERDLTVVDLVGQQASLFMQASMQIEELRRVPVRVAAAQEQERYRLAGELHDTIQQFLGRLPFFLATARDKMKFDQPMSSAILDRCLDDVEEASIVLREIRANLAPNQLTNSLAGPLYNLAGYIEKHTELKVRLDLPKELDEATTVDSRHALYRVIRQATDNAVTHAKATEIDITLQLEDGRTLFLVRDDGHGVGRDELALAAARGSFGLQSMQARVKAAGGEFVFDSAEGQGTTVSGWVPSAG